MARLGEIKPACLLLIALVVAAAPHAEAAASCSTVASSLSPCVGYLQRGGVEPPRPCCDGVESVHNADRTTPDRQATCSCIKSLAPTIGAKEEFVNSLSQKCRVPIPFKYSPSLDCSKVN